MATLLKMKGSEESYYEKITHLAQVDENGSSLLALKRAAETLGYSAAGYRKSISDLATSGPVVAHVVIGEYHHFTVVEGMADGYIFLADPTLGRIAMPIEQFNSVWSGAVLKVSKACTSEPVITREAQASVENAVSEPLSLKEEANPDELHIIAETTEEYESSLTYKFTEVKNEPQPSSEEISHEAVSIEKSESEISSVANSSETPVQEKQLDSYTGEGLKKDIPEEAIEEAEPDIKSIIQTQSA